MYKVLVEKLLYTCPDVRRVYILLREKRGQQTEPRLEDFLNTPAFTGTGRTPRNVLKAKIIALNGDVTVDHLGLSDHDWNILVQEVDVIINSAASVRFDDPMIKALDTNVRGVISCLELCRQAKHCLSFVHVSTSIVHCQLDTLEEKIYPMNVTAEHLMELVKWLPSADMDKLCKDYLFDGRPNSYIFTKALAEDYLVRHAHGLPVAVARLSMVVSSRSEPEVGFIDVAQAGVFVGLTQGLGALRTFDYNPDAYGQCVFVDTSANTLLTIAYVLVTNYGKYSSPSRPRLQVFNITRRLMSYQDAFSVSTRIIQESPLLKAFRPPIQIHKPNWLSYNWNRWVTEWLFVYIIEKILLLFGYNL